MIKKAKHWIPILLIGAFFLGLLIGRPYLLDFISQSQRRHIPANKQMSIKNNINANYNYSENGEEYSYTFLEFGSTGCSACKQMERVMEQIKNKYPNKVKVVFISIMDKSNQDLIDYYGVAAIPFQVVLDRNGDEYFRHTGYISETDLGKYFK